MKDQFVTYEIAKRLKELGFNEACMAYYQYVYYPTKDRTSLRYCPTQPDCYLNDTDDGSRMNGEDCTAPLWQQAIDWLRKKHIKVVESEDWRETNPVYYIIGMGSKGRHGPYLLIHAIPKALELIK
jgi:hypothetical protein